MTSDAPTADGEVPVDAPAADVPAGVATRNVPSDPASGTVVEAAMRTAPELAPVNLIVPTDGINALNGEPVDVRS